VARPTATRARTRATGLRARRAAARTARPSPLRRREFASRRGARRAGSFGSFRGVEPFYFAGGSLAAWALIVTAIGVRREDFPSTPRATRLVAAISIILVATTIGLAIYLSAKEEHEKGSEEHAALVPWA
jgi:hypothetical protein